MKSVLISIQPKWCELIASEKKTVEVRKTKPKLETPFKVYIYCTKDKWQHLVQMPDKSYRIYNGKEYGKYDKSLIFGGEANGKVIGEFVCNKILDYKYGSYKILYGWHISDLKIYDEPKELSEFNKPCDFNYDCFLCDRAVYDKKVITDISGKITKVNNKFIACDDVITRPPQSWCYVEKLTTY